jgi:membrane protein DedA with SNARE-associated domain
MIAILTHFGYLAVLLGTFFEGETILVLGGLAAHQGYLTLSGVIVCAFVGSLAGDQLAFLIGRRKGRAFIDKRPAWRARVQRVTALLERYQTIVTLGFRFVYGFRILVPLVAGASRMKAARFVALNAVGALVWAVAVGSSGYFFGMAIKVVLGDIRRYELMIFGIGLTVAIFAMAVRYLRKPST